VLVPTGSQVFLAYKSFIVNPLRLAVAVPFPKAQVGRHVMIAMLEFATLVVTTVFAAAAAAALHSVFLKAAFLVMRPATAPRIPARTELARGTAQLVRALASQR
jgi:hypothetical protein